jgi:hypothetical protein
MFSWRRQQVGLAAFLFRPHFNVVLFVALRPAPRHALRLIGFADLKFA